MVACVHSPSFDYIPISTLTLAQIKNYAIFFYLKMFQSILAINSVITSPSQREKQLRKSF